MKRTWSRGSVMEGSCSCTYGSGGWSEFGGGDEEGCVGVIFTRLVRIIPASAAGKSLGFISLWWRNRNRITRLAFQ